ncbi:MAG: hypothetical protein ABJA66_10780 [Actinomycetota bacterium]
MKENQSLYAIFQIGLGIICVLIGISGFILSENFSLSLEALFLGIGILLFGLANNNKDKSERGKTLTNIGSIFFLLGTILIFYNTFIKK